jgi:PHD/YefM family antitoxin component YafN of YafNO toxin-antitoxin module
MSANYFSESLMQEMLYLQNLREMEKLTEEIARLRSAIFSKQKKHRRCDKDISKNFNVHIG